MKKILIVLIYIIIANAGFSQDFTMTHDGLTRSYRLHTPTGYMGDSIYPLVVNMHGLGSNAIEQEFYTAFNDVADSAGFLVVYPNGINETWNISSETGVDDVGFISALIDTLNTQYNIDLNRVYATGMSMGGFMSYRLACELDERIAAIASVTGLQAFYPCNPDRPVPVMHFHGTADPVVPYAGVPTTISNWVNYNSCPIDPVITDLPDIDTNDNSTVTVSYYGLCDESTEVILYTIINGEHTWPGASFIIGVTNQDIKASYEIWNFFNKFTLQGSTGIKEDADKQKIACVFYPNPVHDFVTVELVTDISEEVDLRILDMTGKLVLELGNISSRRFLLDCRQIPEGIYIAELSTTKVQSYQKIIVR
jgi:polyhydroxybutyrate depolymerase